VNYTPARADNVLTIDGEKIILTANEYVAYAQAKGQNDLIFRENLITSEGYGLLDDTTKGKAMEFAKDYADTMAKLEIGLKPKVSEWMAELEGADAETITQTLIGKAIDSQTGSGSQRYTDLSEMLDSGVSVGSVIAVLSDDQQTAYNAHIEPAGVPADVYLEAIGFESSATADKDANGNSISGSKKKKVVAYIDGLELDPKQKSAIYLALGYAESKMPIWK
jgi:hypothetical protein